MAGSRPELRLGGGTFPHETTTRLIRALGVCASLGALATAPLHAQVEAVAVLRGQVHLADGLLSSGTVVLHRLTADTQGQIDSTTVSPDGSFAFTLPSVPDPRRSEVYFASIRHDGVLYFGDAVTLAVQLDSLYQIQTYDTMLVSGPVASTRVEVRTVFLEQEEGRWRVTDLFELINEGDRTLVTADGAPVWSHPLPVGADDFQIGQGDLAPGAGSLEGGAFVVRSPIPPGERVFIVRYSVPDPYLSIPTPGGVDHMEFLVREPAPPLEVPALTATDRIEIEEGSTYRRFVADSLSRDVVTVVEGTEESRPPVRWIAVVIALLLAGVGAWAVTPRPTPATGAASVPGTEDGARAVMLEIARLDEAFEGRSAPSDAERKRYRRRRAELLRRLRPGG